MFIYYVPVFVLNFNNKNDLNENISLLCYEST